MDGCQVTAKEAQDKITEVLALSLEQSRGRVRFKVHEREMLSWVSALMGV